MGIQSEQEQRLGGLKASKGLEEWLGKCPNVLYEVIDDLRSIGIGVEEGKGTHNTTTLRRGAALPTVPEDDCQTRVISGKRRSSLGGDRSAKAGSWLADTG